MILDRRRRIKLCFVIWQANRFANKCEKVCTSGIKKIQIINNSLEMIIIFSCVYKGIYLIISKILVMFLDFFFFFVLALDDPLVQHPTSKEQNKYELYMINNRRNAKITCK
jgi:hypothetical protein